MQGLLDWIKTPEGQGLLGMAAGYAANAQRGAPVNSLGRGGLTGLLAYGNAQNRQEESAERAKMGQYRDAQINAFNTKAAADAEALARERAKREALPGLFKAPTMTGGEAMPQELGGVPMFSQQMGVSPMKQQPGGFDVLGAIRAGYSVDEATKLASVPDIGRPEVARTQEVDDGNGGKKVVQLDKFGRPVGQGMAGYVPPVQVDTGKGIQFVRPQAGASFSKQPTFGDDIARGNLGVAQERLAFDKSDPKLTWNNDLGGFVNPRTRQVLPALGGSGQQALGTSGPKLTEVQGNATQFATRMLDASRVIDGLEKTDAPWPSTVARAGYQPEFPSWLPGGQIAAGAIAGINRATVPQQAERYQQAQENWVTANLRKESGAAIGVQEKAQEIRKWFPQPGEGAESIAQKAQARKLAEEAMMVVAGPGRDQALRLARQAAESAGKKNPTRTSGLGSGTALDQTDPLGIR